MHVDALHACAKRVERYNVRHRLKCRLPQAPRATTTTTQRKLAAAASSGGGGGGGGGATTTRRGKARAWPASLGLGLLPLPAETTTVRTQEAAAAVAAVLAPTAQRAANASSSSSWTSYPHPSNHNPRLLNTPPDSALVEGSTPDIMPGILLSDVAMSDIMSDVAMSDIIMPKGGVERRRRAEEDTGGNTSAASSSSSSSSSFSSSCTDTLYPEVRALLGALQSGTGQDEVAAAGAGVSTAASVNQERVKTGGGEGAVLLGGTSSSANVDATRTEVLAKEDPSADRPTVAGRSGVAGEESSSTTTDDTNMNTDGGVTGGGGSEKDEALPASSSNDATAPSSGGVDGSVDEGVGGKRNGGDPVSLIATDGCTPTDGSTSRATAEPNRDCAMTLSEEEDDDYNRQEFEDDKPKGPPPLWHSTHPEETDDVLFEEDCEMPEWNDVPWPLPPVLTAPIRPDDLAEDLIPQALGLYSALFTFMRILRLYPFLPEAFMSALAVEHPIILLDDIHLSVLKLLMISDRAGSSSSPGTHYAEDDESSSSASLKLFRSGSVVSRTSQVQAQLLDVLTWPMFAMDRIERAYERVRKDPHQATGDFAPEDKSGHVYTAAFEAAQQLSVRNYYRYICFFFLSYRYISFFLSFRTGIFLSSSLSYRYISFFLSFLPAHFFLPFFRTAASHRGTN